MASIARRDKDMKKNYVIYQYKTGKRIRKAKKEEVDIYFSEYRGFEGVIQGHQLAEDLADYGRVYVL